MTSPLRQLADLLGLNVRGAPRFMESALKMGADDPRKIIHCLKVGLALTLVSTFYYTSPLYQGLGGTTTIWAVMTIVVIFEFTVGGTLYKGLNRVMATLTAGVIASGIHWLAAKSGETSETIIIGVAAFLLCKKHSKARISLKLHYNNFLFSSRFISLSHGSNLRSIRPGTESSVRLRPHDLHPHIQPDRRLRLPRRRTARIGATPAGHRSHRNSDLPSRLHLGSSRLGRRGASFSRCQKHAKTRRFHRGYAVRCCKIFCIQITYQSIYRLIEALSQVMITESVSEFFRDFDKGNDNEASVTNPRGYKCVLNSKASEESLLNLARWEPMHGRFSYGHPWGHYVIVGTAMRYCAYCIDTLNACIHSENEFQQKTPDHLKKHLSSACIKLGVESSRVLKELATSIESMKRSSSIEVLIGLMHDAVEEVHHLLGTPLPEGGQQKAAILAVALAEATPMITVASLLSEIALRIEALADAVEGLAEAAAFISFEDERAIEKNKSSNKIHVGPQGQEGDLQQV
ncbi:Aluminum-activated malate transporter 10 [Platanthera zijinensis]|uniref:Aluminum-activated malate transporter 10 n=1 Tax=Platanthera zijinensis TaxID=2320716 RepID=A0AAP0BDF4_9ASPA